MRKAIRASVLIMVLAMPAFAGEIPYGITSTSPTDTATQPGEIPYGVTSSSEPTTAELLVDLLVALVS